LAEEITCARVRLTLASQGRRLKSRPRVGGKAPGGLYPARTSYFAKDFGACPERSLDYITRQFVYGAVSNGEQSFRASTSAASGFCQSLIAPNRAFLRCFLNPPRATSFVVGF